MSDDLSRLKSALRATSPRAPDAIRERAISEATAAFDRHHQEGDGEARRKGRVPSRGRSWIRRLATALSRPHLAFAGTATVVVVAGIVSHQVLATPPAPPPGMLAPETGSPTPTIGEGVATASTGAMRRGQAPGRLFRDCAQCPQMVVVPAGSFMMGSKEFSDEGPPHRVTIAEAFAVGVHETTFAEWDACRRAGGCTHGPNDGGWGRETRPVIDVSWEDAQQYVRWLSRTTGKRYRLPSESEWEYAARAGTATRYWWGDSPGGGRANCRGCWRGWNDDGTMPVGSFVANPFGLHDVHGNVWEWVEDCWRGSHAKAPGDGGARTRGGECGSRVLRGGSWIYTMRGVRAAVRFGAYPGIRSDDVGFRVARVMD